MRQNRITPRKTLLALALCAPLLSGACGGGQPDAPNNASTSATPAPTASAQPTQKQKMQEVVANVEEVKLDAGGSGEAVITLDIAEGFHVHSNPASDKFYIATEVKAEPREGLTPGKPTYPKPVTHRFEFSDKPLSVYEGRAVIRLPLRADKTAAKGRHTLSANIRVQPCNDQTCLPPRDINAAIPVVVN
ncbi:MAG: protein-disulfide reductase DsbD domain-containing protein [Pyrinomonadaceae bacterium]